ncbi:MAG: hypothetical protein AAFY10_14775 [Pseudomonadota bacterium]
MAFGKKTKSNAPDLSRVLNQPRRPAPLPAVSDRIDGCDTWNQCLITSETGLRQEGIVVEISETEAHLRFVSRSSLPERFQVKIFRLGETRSARVLRQDGNDVYIEFVRELDEPCERLGIPTS